MTPYHIDFEALATNPFGLALAHGRMKATITDSHGTHLTVAFKAWKRGVKGRVALAEADRLYIEIPGQSWRGDKVASIDMTRGVMYENGTADSYRVEQATKILDVAQGKAVSDRVQHPGSCMICGRELTDPVSIDRGIGPDCFGSATDSAHQTKVKRTPESVKAVQEVLATDEPHIILASDNAHYGVRMQSKYCREAVTDLKAVTDWRGRKWDSHTQTWWIPRSPENAKALLTYAQKWDMTLSPAARADMNGQSLIEKKVLHISVQNLTLSNGKVETSIVVKFDFGAHFNDVLARVKSIPAKQRSFSTVEKHWLVEPTKQSAGVLAGLCKDYSFDITDEAVAILKPLRQQAEREAATASLRTKLSTADDADVEIPGFGYEPMAFQRAGIMYGDFASDRYMIADEQGLGKTIQALGRIALKQQFPAIVVAPSAVKVKWARAAKQAMPERNVQILEGKKGGVITGDIVIVNYDILSAWKDSIIDADPMALVLDESHYIKNRKAKRTEAAKTIAKAIPAEGSVILLSGTPVLNRPIELVEQLDVMGRLDDFGGFTGFVSKYVGWEVVEYGPKRGTNIPAPNGAMNLTELNERLRSTCYVRRLKRDVLTELPEKRREVVPMALNGKEYARALKEARQRLKSGESSGYADHLAEIAHLRKAAAKGKMDAVKEWVTDFLETGEKLVLFAHHREVQQELADHFGALRIAGGSDQSKADRQAAMDEFQSNPDAKLIVCSMTAAREGIDLFAASNLAFVELGWNPGVHDQAEDRIHRIGQDRGTMMSYLLAEDTIDEKMSALIEQKRAMKDAATEGGEVINEADHDMVGDIINWIMETE